MSKNIEYYWKEYGGDDEEAYQAKRQKRHQKPHHGSSQEDSSDEEMVAHTPEIDLPATAQLVTEALRDRLEGVGITDPVVLARANIYQNAISDLSRILAQTPLSEQLRQESTQELGALAQTLEILFSGQISLSSKRGDDNNVSFEGRFSLPGGESRRMTILQRLQSSDSGLARITCQIRTNPIEGITTRKRLVAATKEVVLRCGLSYRWDNGTNWIVSIDSGQCLKRSPLFCQQWKRTFPLSNAIRAAKDHFILGMSRKDGDYTFHYQDPDTGRPDWESAEKLRQLNMGLNEIFQKMVVNHIDWAFSKTLKVI